MKARRMILSLVIFQSRAVSSFVESLSQIVHIFEQIALQLAVLVLVWLAVERLLVERASAEDIHC